MLRLCRRGGRRIRRQIRRLAGDRAGVSAVEFALVAPVMIVIFIGTIELPRAYATKQRLVRATRSMADLISRGSLTSVTDVYAAGRAVMYPSDASGSGIILTAAGVYQLANKSYEARVCSSAADKATKRVANAILGEPPPSEARVNARYMMAEMTYRYVPIFNLFPALNDLTFSQVTTWPVRSVTGAPVVLPGGAACP